MRNLEYFIVSFVLLILSSCNHYPEIKLVDIPECTVLSSGMICDIPRGFKVPDVCYLSNTDRPEEYECSSIPEGWQTTSPEGYKKFNEDLDKKMAELAKLRRRYSKSLEE